MEKPKIFQQIPKIMKQVGAIGKNGRNSSQNYNFRSIDDVYNALQPVLSDNQVFFIPEVLESHESAAPGGKGIRVRLKVKYKIFADDGSSIDSVVEGEGIDFSDKATNKALTAAFKYMLIQIFCIAVEGMEDADKSTPETHVPKDTNQALQKHEAKQALIEMAKKEDVIKVLGWFQKKFALGNDRIFKYLNVSGIETMKKSDLTKLKKISEELTVDKNNLNKYFPKNWGT